MDAETIVAIKGALLPTVAIPCILLAYIVKMVILPSDGTLFLTVIGLMAGLGGYVGGRVHNALKLVKSKKIEKEVS